MTIQEAQDSYETYTFGSVVAGGVETSGAEIAAQAAGLAKWFSQLGSEPGDRIAIITTDTTAFTITFAACLHNGLTAVVIDPLAAPGEVARMLKVTRAVATIADDAVVEALDGGAHAMALEPKLLVRREVRQKSKGLGNLLSKFLRTAPAENGPWLDDIKPQTMNWDLSNVDEEVPAYVIFTSGTTSKPKGVVVSRRALFAHLDTMRQVFGYGPEATFLNYLPLHHTDGLVHGPAATLLTGMQLIRPSDFSMQAANALPELLRAHHVTHFLAVPTMLSIIHRIFESRQDLFQTEWFRHAISIAGYLPEKFWGDFEQTFDVRISNVYGLSETVSGSLYCGPLDESYRHGTLGKPVDCQVRIVDDEGAPVADQESGVLQIAGSHLMAGYLDDPEATAAILKDGWLDTGDIVKRRNDGFFEFVGRRKAIINRGGVAVYPEDVRRALEELDWIREVEVVGAPDPVFEEIILVCAVLEPGKSERDVHTACMALLAPERRPDRVFLMSSLPRGPSGKVRREEVLAQALQTVETPAELEDTVAEDVLTLAAEVFQVERHDLSAETTADEVANWDSYAQLELVMQIEEKFTLRLSPKDLMQLRSLGDAIEIVRQRQKD